MTHNAPIPDPLMNLVSHQNTLSALKETVEVLTGQRRVEQLSHSAVMQHEADIIRNDLAYKAPLDSPVFTGDPRAPTPAVGDSDNSIATTAFVMASIGAAGGIIDVPLDDKVYARRNAAWVEGATKLYIDSQDATKLNASAYTAADVLAKIKTVDGVGSGLDADLLDGLSSASFALLSGATFTGNVITNNGYFKVDRIGDAAIAAIYMDADVGWPILTYMRTGTSTRWYHGKNGTPESGGNAGSQWQLVAHDDAGVSLGAVLTAYRSTRVVDFAVSPTAPTPTVGDNTTQLATTAFVQGELDSFIATANTWTQPQTITMALASTALLTLLAIEDSASVGPMLDLQRVSATPAVNDFTGYIRFLGRNSLAADITYSQIGSGILSPTSGAESGFMRFQTKTAGGGLTSVIELRVGAQIGAPTGGDMGAGTLNATTLYEGGVSLADKYAELAVANTFTAAQIISITTASAVALQLISTEAGAASGPLLDIYRNSASPAANDSIGHLRFLGRNSASAIIPYASILAQIVTPTAGSEDSRLYFYTYQAGTVINRLTLDAGVYVGTAVDKGVNTFNAPTIYENGVALDTKYGQLAVANTWTASQEFKAGSTHGGTTATGRVATFSNDGILTLRYGNNATVIPLAIINQSAAVGGVGVPAALEFKHGVGELQGSRITSIPTADYANAANATANLYMQYASAGVLANGLIVGANGALIGNATGGQQGINTLNAQTLYEAGVSLADKYAELAAVNTFTATQVINVTSISPLTIISTNEDVSALQILLRRDSASPAANDYIAGLFFQGKDSLGNIKTYNVIYSQIVDPTNGSEDGRLRFDGYIAGTNNILMYIGAGVQVGVPTGGDKGVGTLNATTLYEAGTSLNAKYAQLATQSTFTANQIFTTMDFTNVVSEKINFYSGGNFAVGVEANTLYHRTATYFRWYGAGPADGGASDIMELQTNTNTLILKSYSDTASLGPLLIVRRDSPSPAAGDNIGSLYFQGNDSGGALETYARIIGNIVDPTAGSEDSGLIFQGMVAGVLGTRMTLGAGLYMPAATGADKGSGTINATAVYDDNVLLTCVPLQPEFLQEGRVDIAKWNAVSPNSHHAAANEFLKLLDSGFDPRDTKQYIERAKKNAALPGMPTFDEWKHGEYSTGEMISKLWLALEMLAVAWMASYDRVR